MGVVKGQQSQIDRNYPLICRWFCFPGYVIDKEHTDTGTYKSLKSHKECLCQSNFERCQGENLCISQPPWS